MVGIHSCWTLSCGQMRFGDTLTLHLFAMLVMRMLKPDLSESGPEVIAAAAGAMAASCYRESIISAGDETQALASSRCCS